ncbi:MAG: hypothetical protein CMA27_04610 [Euryarchaeota archaeon]|nr:hypothetical protein [Euryarchaeota archaeon]|tara:strand:+ start:640 stop:1617 length:978 start_codon:yes stop_codon:yes gene_type:complete
METRLEDLLSSLGVQFEEHIDPLIISEIRCYGKIRYLPETMINIGAKKGQYIWSAGKSWMDFSRSELEAWLVDAPDGDHIIVVEGQNNVDIPHQCPDGVKVDLWGRDKLALLIGYSVLDGTHKKQESNARSTESEIIATEIEPSSIYSRISNGTLTCIKSLINPNDSLESLGISQVPCQPILLELCFWLVKGNLIGPENSTEEREWVILEDNFSDELTLVNELDNILQVPSVPILCVSSSNSNEKIRNNLNRLCDERRHESISTSELNSGKLLRWWRIDKKSIECSPKRVLMPSWAFISPIDGKKIINGLNGKILDFRGELKGID